MELRFEPFHEKTNVYLREEDKKKEITAEFFTRAEHFSILLAINHPSLSYRQDLNKARLVENY